MTETIGINLKLVFHFTTRPQTNASQVAGWLNRVEGYTENKVTELIGTADPAIGAVLLENIYENNIIDQGTPIEYGGERLWEIYPDRGANIEINDGQKAALRAHMDIYFTDLQDEIRAAIAAAPVVNRATVIDWHMHLSFGSVDEVEP